MYWFGKGAIAFFICLVAKPVFGQDSTRYLNQVEVVGLDLSKYASGTVLKEIKGSKSGSLADIGDNSTTYLKNYGSKQLATISMRGTSASHTNVIWNGIPVNSPTLGQTDFSVWPLFLTNKLIVQKGGGSSLFGSGAIGGTVILDNGHILTDSTVTMYGGVGSFGLYEGGLKVHVSPGKWVSESIGFASEIQNDFPVEGGGKQEHAAVERYGFSQKLAYRFDKGEIFSELAFANNERQIQPTRTSASRDFLETKNFRSVINLKLNGVLKHNATIGFISDQTIYNSNAPTKSYRLVGTHAIENIIGQSIHFRAGTTGIHEWADSENFSQKEIRNQVHLFASGTWYPTSVSSVTLNLREVIQGTDYVFIPSMGFETLILRQNQIELGLRGQVSWDYRIPTFNDLFWRPGGNPELNPERSMNYEMGLDLNVEKHTIRMTVFTSSIDDWIQWEPTNGVWSPRNIREVRTKGIEVNTSSRWNLGQILFQLNTEYAHTLSSDQGVGEDNQLPYVPKNSVFGALSVGLNNSTLKIVGNLTDERFTTLSNSASNQVDGFFLTDLTFTQNISSKNNLVEISGKVQNVFDEDYENIKNTAMPGRAFKIEITTKL